MSGQVQELQVPGTPEGGTLARVLARTLPYTVLGLHAVQDPRALRLPVYTPDCSKVQTVKGN
jgi:hypothetical protein